MKRLIFLIIGSPIIWGISTLFLMVIVGPFIDNISTVHDSVYLFGMISFMVVVAPIWISLIFRYRIDPTGKWHQIEHVAKLISYPFRLSFEEVKLINKVEGWEYKTDNELRLDEDELKEAFLLAIKAPLYGGANSVSGSLAASIFSFIWALIFLYAVINWKDSSPWPFIGLDVLLFYLSYYFYKSFKIAKKYADSLKGEVQ
jgi:hypothetical protein